MCFLRFYFGAFNGVYSFLDGDKNGVAFRGCWKKQPLFEKFLAQVFALLSVLFSSVHFLHRVIILFNLSLKMLRGGRQTAELSLLKWYWTSKRVSISPKKKKKKNPAWIDQKAKQRMLQFPALHLQTVTFGLIFMWLLMIFKWPFCGAGDRYS